MTYKVNFKRLKQHKRLADDAEDHLNAARQKAKDASNAVQRGLVKGGGKRVSPKKKVTSPRPTMKSPRKKVTKKKKSKWT